MQTNELIYLACPFRHEDPKVQKMRCAAAHRITAQLIAQGKHVFSPLTHNEVLVDICDDKIPKEYWMQFDLNILSRCNRLLVLKLEGWDISKGVQREMQFARERDIPIEMIDLIP